MKKLIMTLLVCIAGSTFTNAQTADDYAEVLRQAIPQINESFPINASVVTMDSVGYDGANLIYYITVDESKVAVADYEASLAQSALEVMASLLGSEEDNPELYDALINSNSNVVYKLCGNKSGNGKNSVVITNRQLRMITGNITKEDAADFVNEYIMNANSTLPQDVGDGMTFKKIELENGYIVYYFDTDESIMSMQAYQDYKQKGTYMEESLMESMKSMDNVQTDMINNCIYISGLGIRYVYYGTQSEESVSFDITPQMFKEKVIGE